MVELIKNVVVMFAAMHTITHMLDITCRLFILFGYTLQLDLCVPAGEKEYSSCVVVLHTTKNQVLPSPKFKTLCYVKL